jgi:hypothetical protein
LDSNGNLDYGQEVIGFFSLKKIEKSRTDKTLGVRLEGLFGAGNKVE